MYKGSMCMYKNPLEKTTHSKTCIASINKRKQYASNYPEQQSTLKNHYALFRGSDGAFEDQ